MLIKYSNVNYVKDDEEQLIEHAQRVEILCTYLLDLDIDGRIILK
jgi:hypothetical protein